MIKIDSEEINDKWCQELRVPIINVSKGGPGSGIKGHTTHKEDKAHRIIRSFEERIINEPIEHSLFVDGDGEVILQKSGEERHVTFLEDELWDIKLASDVVFTHNHPKSFVGPFSLNDVRFIAKQEIKEGRVVSGNKLYIIKLKGKISPDLIQEKYKKAYEAEYFKYSMKVTSGELTNKEGNDMFFDKIWSDVAKKTPQLTYKKESAFQKGGVGSGIRGHTTAEEKKYKNILSFENQVRNEKKENGLLCDKDGNVLLVLEGTEDTILFSASEKEFLFNKAAGGIFTHNHPIGNGFSKADIFSSMRAKLQEIRAVGKEYTYSIKFKKEVPAHIRDEFSHRYDQVFAETYIIFTQKIFDGMPDRKAQQLCFHEMTQRYSEEYSEFFTYERTKSFSKGGVGSGIKGHRTAEEQKSRLYKVVEDFEEKYRNRVSEIGLTVDKEGNVLLIKKGTKTSIKYTPEEWDILSSEKSYLFTHNHGNDATLSPADFDLMWKAGLKETRAVGPTNTFILTFKKKIPEKIFYKMLHSINYKDEVFYHKYTSKVKRGEMKADIATIAYADESMETFVEEFPEYLSYEKITTIKKGGVGSGIKGHKTHKEDKGYLKAIKEIELFEAQIKNEPYEYGRLIDKEGNILFSTEGRNPNSIYITDQQADILHSRKGFVFTHNHPVSMSFSIADIYTSIKYNTKEVRAVSKRYLYVMKFKRYISLKDFESREEVYQGIYMKLFNQYQRKILGGEITSDEASIQMIHNVWKNFVKMYPKDFEYTREPSKKGYGDIEKGGPGSGIKGHKTQRKIKAYKMIKDFENRVRGESTESCLAVDGEGKVLISKQGTESAIFLTENEKYKCIEGAKKGKIIFTHNHPSSSSFSLSDILTANAFHYSEIRIAGKKHDYEMKISKTLNKNEVINSYRTENAYYYEKFNPLVTAEKLDGNKAWMTHSHLIWKHVAEEIDGLEYKRTR